MCLTNNNERKTIMKIITYTKEQAQSLIHRIEEITTYKVNPSQLPAHFSDDADIHMEDNGETEFEFPANKTKSGHVERMTVRKSDITFEEAGGTRLSDQQTEVCIDFIFATFLCSKKWKDHKEDVSSSAWLQENDMEGDFVFNQFLQLEGLTDVYFENWNKFADEGVDIYNRLIRKYGGKTNTPDITRMEIPDHLSDDRGTRPSIQKIKTLILLATSEFNLGASNNDVFLTIKNFAQCFLTEDEYAWLWGGHNSWSLRTRALRHAAFANVVSDDCVCEECENLKETD